MIEVEVKMLGSGMDNNVPIVVLRSKEDDRGILLVAIGIMEAYAIHLGLENKSMPRPITHDLISNILDECRIEVQRIEITDLSSHTFYGIIQLKQDDEILRIDSRPSDAIALALRKEVPIYVADDVAEEAFMYGDPQEYVDSLEFKDMF